MSPPASAPLRRARRRWGLLPLVLVVALLHLWLTRELAQRLPAPGQSNGPDRLQAMYTRQLTPTAPPPPPAAPAALPPAPRPPAAVKTPAAAPAAVASAADAEPADRPEPPASEAEPVPTEPAASDGTAVAQAPPAASQPEASASMAEEAASEPAAVPAVADAASASGPAFEWPPSTRMSYKLFGYYRGDVHGSAQVEWVKQDEHYQVHVEVMIGPSFAPLMSRRMSSDGLITPDGLAPMRYDEVTRFGFSRRQTQVRFDGDTVTLHNGRQFPALPGVQDSASQFVQLTQRFMRQPGLLRQGQVLEVPLALPRRQDRWYYDVLGEETLDTPFGRLPAFHLKPRRELPLRNELSAEIWFAPSLMYLPVRIRIRQDAETYVDLMISRLPEQAVPLTSRTPGTPP
ncbi:DUF3108 domain-containing protein [Eleftheria terrae]|uniref:DUF3108 domain-containing protein n=1 Tax=Eleftheria terrae TaxID=1597781 RepID=UPI00263AA89D|nr:DUF3108 domain-containing protein [Eleftheria terrae]WKB54612.1 DUF3108 domain-containing protein [Eleftheria terrae]